MREVLGDDPRFRLHASDEQRGVYRNFERALERGARGGGARRALRPGRPLAPGQARRRSARRSARGPSSPTATCASSRANGEEISDTYWTERRNNHTNFASLLIANTVTGAASMLRREVLDYALPFPQELPEQRHDHWLATVAMARGDIAYVPRPLYDYVQHADAALGHTRANQGAGSSTLAERMETMKKGSVLDGWGLVHYQHYRRLVLAATVLELAVLGSARQGQEEGDRPRPRQRLLARHGVVRRTRRPGTVRWGHRDDAARQQPRTLDRLASHHAVTCPASRRAGPGRSGRRGTARPPAGRRRPPRSRAGGSGRRALQVVPRPGGGEPDGDQPFHPPALRSRPPDAAGAEGHLVRDRTGRVLRDHRAKRLGQEHALEAHGEHLPRGPGQNSCRWADRPHHRAGPRLSPGAGRSGQPGGAGRDDGLDEEAVGGAVRASDVVRGPPGIRVDEAQELLVRDEGPPGFRHHGRGRRRRDDDRRGPRGRRQRLPAQEPRHLPELQGPGEDGHPRQPPDDRDPGALRPRDAARGRPHRADRGSV